MTLLPGNVALMWSRGGNPCPAVLSVKAVNTVENRWGKPVALPEIVVPGGVVPGGGRLEGQSETGKSWE